MTAHTESAPQVASHEYYVDGIAVTSYAPEGVQPADSELAVISPGFGQSRGHALIRQFGQGLAAEGYTALTLDPPFTYGSRRDPGDNHQYCLRKTITAIQGVTRQAVEAGHPNTISMVGYSGGSFIGAHAALELAESDIVTSRFAAIQTPASGQQEHFEWRKAFERAVAREQSRIPTVGPDGKLTFIYVEREIGTDYDELSDMKVVFDALARLPRPPKTLMVASPDDTIAKFPPIEALHHQIPKTGLVTVAGVPHGPAQTEHIQALLDPVAAWMGKDVPA